uniref:CZB domain-containing protein n=1 Tax=Sulfurimonas sp. TaxID=2022749 RepID=UPI002638B1BC
QCDVGQWLYDEKYHLESLLGSQFYSELDAIHETWHLEYARIYKIFFSEKKEKGLFSKLFASSKIDPLELDKAKLYYAELNETTQKLLCILEKSQRRLSALNESKFS